MFQWKGEFNGQGCKQDDRNKGEKEGFRPNITWVLFSINVAKINSQIEEEKVMFLTLFQRKKNTDERRLPRGNFYTLIMLGINRETPFMSNNPLTSPQTQP